VDNTLHVIARVKWGLALPVILLLYEHKIYAHNTNNNKLTKAWPLLIGTAEYVIANLTTDFTVKVKFVIFKIQRGNLVFVFYISFRHGYRRNPVFLNMDTRLLSSGMTYSKCNCHFERMWEICFRIHENKICDLLILRNVSLCCISAKMPTFQPLPLKI